MLLGVNVTCPAAVGVMVNVCAAEEVLNVFVIVVLNPPPETAIEMSPVNTPFGVIVKLLDAALSDPPLGPVKV